MFKRKDFVRANNKILLLVLFTSFFVSLLIQLFPNRDTLLFIYWPAIAIHFIAYLICTFKWTYCSLSNHNLRSIRYNELWLLVLRWIHFLCAIVLICLAIFTGMKLVPNILFPFAAFLWVSFFHAFSRTTFRPLPCYLLSLSAVFLFLCFTGIPYPDSNMWGLGSFGNDLIKLLSDEKTWPIFTSGAIAVVLVPVAGSLGKNLLDKYRNLTEDTAEKSIRRQLLSHWWYNPKAVIIENANVCVAIAFVATCIVAVLLSLNSFVTSGHKYVFTLYFSAFASTLSIVGIVWLFSIRENELLKSEYFFLLYTSLQIGQFQLSISRSAKKKGKNKLCHLKRHCFNRKTIRKLYQQKKISFKESLSRQRWVAHLTRGMFGCVNAQKAVRRLHDFSQVASHLLTNNSTIHSENEVVHHINFVFECISDVVCSRETHGMLISELLNSFLETLEKSFTSSSPKATKSKRQQNNIDTTASAFSVVDIPENSELLFHSVFLQLLQADLSGKCPAIANISSCVAAMRQALEDEEIKWRLLSPVLSINELIRIVQYDGVLQTMQMHSKGGCIASWQCDKKCACYRPDYLTTSSEGDAIHNQRVTALLYPLFVLQSLINRCPDLDQEQTGFEKTIQLIMDKYYVALTKYDTAQCPAKRRMESVELDCDSIERLCRLFDSFKQQVPEVLRRPVIQFIASQRDAYFADASSLSIAGEIDDLVVAIVEQQTHNIPNSSKEYISSYWTGISKLSGSVAGAYKHS